jgi:hypothetical protein
VDLRSDIYSLAIIIYEMLAGVPPFVSQSATEMLVMQITAEPPPLRQHLPDLPEYVEQTVMRALAKDREKRFSTVDHFVGALQGAYPALTVQGGTPAPAWLRDRPPGQSLYSAQGFGYQKTPPPVLVGGFASRVGMTPAPTSLPNQTITTLSHAKGESVSPSPDSPSMSDLESIRPRRWPLALGLVGVAAAASLFFTFRPDRTPADGPLPRQPAPIAAAPKPAVVPEPASIRLEIRSSPAGATVFNAKDGTVLGMTPLERMYPQGNGTLNVLLRLHGYRDKTVTVGLEGNSATVVDLERMEATAPSNEPKPVAAPAISRKPGGARKPPQTTQNKEEEWLVH